MPDYMMKVIIQYPVQAVNTKDALDTVPMILKIKYINSLVKGRAEIRDISTKKVVKAKLN